MTATVLDLAKRIRDGQFLPAACDQHTRYQKGCPACQRAAAARRRAHDRAAAYGWRRPEKLLPADGARAHLAYLHTEHQVSYRRIANLAGLAPAPVQKIAVGVQPTATQNTIDAILAVQPDGVRRTLRGNVIAVGAARRLQALMYHGYRAEDLASALHTDPETVRRWRRCYFPSIAPERHEQIVELADRLDGTRGPSTIAHQRAVANRWVPISAWDDIDNPDEQPNVGGDPDNTVDEVLVRRAIHTPALAAGMNGAERVELARQWRQYRLNSDEPYGYKPFAATFGIKEFHAQQIMRAANQATPTPDPNTAVNDRTNRKVA